MRPFFRWPVAVRRMSALDGPEQEKRCDRMLSSSATAIGDAESDHQRNGRIAMLKSGRLKSCFTALAFVASVFWSGTGSAQDAAGTLTGVVTDPAGKPLEGAFVQMKNAERRLFFMVISKDQGRYSNNR